MANVKSASPMDQWPNDDLLLREDFRDYLYEYHPGVAPFFDASDLHDIFLEHDLPANLAKRKSRLWGLIAVGLGFLSLSITACAPLIMTGDRESLPWSLGISSSLFGVLVSSLAVASVVIGYSQALRGESKRSWMKHRLWTERIRQLHFQVIANNLSSIGSAIASGSYDGWRKMRREEIERFRQYHMASTDELLEVLWSDQAEEKTWVNPDWQEAPLSDGTTVDLGEFFRVYVQQRFGIQMRYARLRLAGGLESVRTQSQAIAFGTDLLTMLALADSVSLAVMYILGLGLDSLAVQFGTAALGLFGGAVIALRALEDGLKCTAETDRLEWYCAAVTGLQERFERSEVLDDKVDIMRDMERLSYQEMRRFFVTCNRSRFIL